MVLARLLAAAGREIVVGEDPSKLIATALGDHLRDVLKEAFPAGSRAAARRGRALLALRELADARGRRDEGMPAGRLAAAIGEDGGEILARLAAPEARLIVAREDDDAGVRFALSHDRLAEAVRTAVEEEGAKLEADRAPPPSAACRTSPSRCSPVFSDSMGGALVSQPAVLPPTPPRRGACDPRRGACVPWRVLRELRSRGAVRVPDQERSG